MDIDNNEFVHKKTTVWSSNFNVSLIFLTDSDNPPTEVTVYNVTDEPSSLRVTWTQALEPSKSNCSITMNKITWTVAGSDTLLNETEISSANNLTITGLEGCTNYKACVMAATDTGNYGPSACDTGITGVVSKWLVLWLLWRMVVTVPSIVQQPQMLIVRGLCCGDCCR